MKVLITGPSGAGKTYLSMVLGRSGISTVDLDSIEGLSSWYDGKGNKVKLPANVGKEFLDNHSFYWDRNFLINYLKNNPVIYLFGMSGNVFKMIDLFDKVFYLDVPEKVIKERLKHQSRENQMGKTEYQQTIVVEYAKKLRRKAKDLKIPFIDATLSPEKIFDLIKY